jgi:hypothetical protein
LVWILGLWCRLQSRAAVHDKIQVRERYLVDAGFVVAGLLLASNEWLKSCVLLLAGWAAFYEASADAAGMLLVFVLFVFGGDMAIGIGVSVAYASWEVLLTKIPWRDTTNTLPSWGDFLEALPLAESVYKEGHAGGQRDLGNEYCVLCQTDSDCPYRIPCKTEHLICADCLIRRWLADKNQCPLCCVRLYTFQRRKTTFYELYIASLSASCVLDIVILALECYKGSYTYAALGILILAPIRWDMWHQFIISRTGDEGYTASWQTGNLCRWAVGMMLFAFYVGHRIRKSDQATFVDGKLAEGLKVGTGYTFVWER